MLEDRIDEAVICSALKLDEQTKVYLIGKRYTESGIVRSCQASGENFIVTIVINSQIPNPPAGPKYDPGALLLDSFITEEQAMQILDEIDKEIEGQQFRALASLVKFTFRSSTALVSNGFFQVWDRFRQATAPVPVLSPPPRPPSWHDDQPPC